ncbi:hypothetical protein KFL_005800030 [Klebsormidium nitens]|uniref:EF-hand domain-containing protein n=1 Tax=Klebsormidium nitens TaxID=105231 RepID=A0A1Y1IGE1_KLENI|nr:hypothetical protein KFL_005800030 [Klebsormidium nitens]|eukprot:GAQ89944.1 hypothetical protein KFL_005800030 [Klebsormidium nitens]
MYLDTVSDHAERKKSHSMASALSQEDNLDEDGRWRPGSGPWEYEVEDEKELAASRPKKHIRDHVNKPFHNLTLSDIEGAHPKLKQPFRQPRGTDPLDPAYVITAYDEPEPDVPRFSKDALDVSDVAGARPRKKLVRRITDPLKIDDIPGSTAAWRPRRWAHFGKAGHIRDFNLHVHDINARVQRKVRESTAEIYAPVKGSQPKQLFRQRRNLQEQDFIIRTDDIPGARSPVKTRPASAKLHPTNDLSDIRGAAAASASFNGRLSIRKAEVHARAERVQTRESFQNEVLTADLRGRIESQMGEKTTKEVMGAFRMKDRSGSGKLTVEELGQSLTQLRIPVTPAEAQKLAAAFDTQLSGFVDYKDLAKSFAPHLFLKKEGPTSGPAAGKPARPQSAHPVLGTFNSVTNRAPKEVETRLGTGSATQASAGPSLLDSGKEKKREALPGGAVAREEAERMEKGFATRPASSSGNTFASRTEDRSVPGAREGTGTAWAERLTRGDGAAEAVPAEPGLVSIDESHRNGAAFSEVGRLQRPQEAVPSVEGNPASGTLPSGTQVPAPISLFQDFVNVGGPSSPGNHLVWDLQPETGRMPGTERLLTPPHNGLRARPQSAAAWAQKSRGSGFQAATDSRALAVQNLRAQAMSIGPRSAADSTAEMSSGPRSTGRPQSARPASSSWASGSSYVASTRHASVESGLEQVRSASVVTADSERAAPGHVSSAWVEDSMRRATVTQVNAKTVEIRSRPQSAHPSIRANATASSKRGEEGGFERSTSKIEAQREAQWLKQEIAAVRALV